MFRRAGMDCLEERKLSEHDKDDNISPYLRKSLRKYLEVVDEIRRRSDRGVETVERTRGENAESPVSVKSGQKLRTKADQ